MTTLGALSAPSQTNTIFPNMARTGTLSGAAFQVYEFSAVAGEKLSAYMAVTANTTTFEPSILMVGPDGASLATATGITGAFIPWMQITNSGKFSVICRDGDGVGAGGYSVTVAIDPRRFGGFADPAEFNQIQSAYLRRGEARGGDVDIYEFNAQASDRVMAFLASVTGSLGPVVTLHGPTGSELATASGAQSATLQPISVNSPGTYYLACRDADAVSGSTYWLVLALNPAIEGETNALVPGIARCGFLELGQSNQFQFAADAGDAVSISMGTYFGSHFSFGAFPAIDHPIFPSVSLYGPDNTALLTKSASNGVWIPSLLLTNSGTYRLVCADNNNSGEGIYSVTVAKYPGPNEAEPGEAATLVPGVVPTGNASGGDLDVYQFDVIEGDSVAIRLRHLSGLNSLLSFFLIGPGGALVPGITEPLLDQHIPCLPRTGTYWLGVHLLDGKGEVGYSVESYLWPGPPGSGPLDSLQIVNCGTDAVLRWRTNDTAGFRLQAALTLAEDPAATIWSDLAPPPYSARDGFYFFTNSIGSSFQSFRLIKP